MHPHRLVAHVQPRKPGQRIGDALFPARLHVGQLTVGNPRGGPTGQVVEAVHLRAARREQCLFGRSARHRARAQIADKGPGAEDRRRALFDRVHIDHTGEALGHRLYNRQRNGGRGRGTRLTCREQKHRHATADAILHRDAAFLGEFHGRDDEAVGIADKWPLKPFLFTTRNHMQHLEAIGDMGGVTERGADMLFRACQAAVKRVEVHLAIVLHIAADHRALVEMDIVEIIDEAGSIIEILRGRLPVVMRDRIDDMHRRPRRAEMHIRTR